ncbi:MOG interacting and ectopic P-granules protein 1 [Caerostris extrusa]|uniref:MOG interacting and ectopic P-granules protein 1 n=1 Tax=Caerostris extrusa TaxID=172846 RepID=A0AAV4R4G9_CAEEX|nr:MOG interacting and ectopic P-granules protein 1 [Caerostris extrusa]
MDSVINGEVSEECLNDIKEADIISEDVKDPILQDINASKADVSKVDDLELDNCSKLSTSVEENIEECEEILTQKENGISNSTNLDAKKCNTSIMNENEKLHMDIINDVPAVEEVPSSLIVKELPFVEDKLLVPSSDGDLSAVVEESENDSIFCSKKYDEKEDSVSLIEEDCIALNDQELDLNNSNDFKNKAINELKTAASAKHFKAGSSVMSSCESPINVLKQESKQISQDNKIIDLKKKSSKAPSDQDVESSTFQSNNENAVNNVHIDDEEPLNFSTVKELISTKTLNSDSKTSDVNNCVDLSINKWSQDNPLDKLNEHLKSIGADKERTPLNNIQGSDICPLPKVVEKNNSSVICDKENKNVDSHHHERDSKESSDSFVFSELSNEETGFPDVFTGLVTIGKYISVKGDFTLRSSEALVESPSLVAPYLLKEPDNFPPKGKESKSEAKDFFHSAAGEILIGIGISRVNEWFHKDMVRIKKKQMKRNGVTPQLEEELKMHENFYAEAKKANSVYSFAYKSCKVCGFTSESSIVLEGHLLVPHITQRREYQCNFCDSINRDPKLMLEHMLNEHGKVGRIQPPVLFFECPYCSFESNSKVKLNNHLAKCQRYFDHGINQAPPKDFEFPALTPKPITVAVVKAYEKSLGSMQRGRGRPKKDISESLHMNQYATNANLVPLAPNHMPAFRASSNSPLADSLSMQNQIISPIQMPNMNVRPAHGNLMNQLRPAISHLHMPAPNRFFHFVNPTGQVMPIMGNNHLVTSPSQFPFSPTIETSVSKKANSPSFNPMIATNLRQQNSSKGMPNVTITPLPKLQGPYPVPMAKPSTASGSTSMQSNSLVVCEICDGYIKDLDQLRTHMQLIHKVKIHPKMLVSRPPLNCQKCQWRFFTDQGLERHLLGAHGLVTSNMQELANKGKDAGCCTICGRVYASKLVNHMNQVHKITLKPAHLSYKCTVCSATFNLYRLFENHVYLVHSGAAKRSTDGRSSPSKRIKSVDDSAGVEPLNHKDKSSSKEVGDENVNKCKECGNKISNDKKSHEKCDKCLKSDELIQGTLSTKTLNDELKKEKKVESAAALV